MNYPIDLSLFQRSAHNPSFLALKRSMGKEAAGDLVDFCVPVNPYFPTTKMFQRYRNRLEEILKYYPEQNRPIADVLASVLELESRNLVLANGSTELITWIDHLFIKENIATPIPTFGRWTDQSAETGKEVFTFTRKEEDEFDLPIEKFVQFIHEKGARVAVVCNPNNPTGRYLSRENIRKLLTSLSHLDLVVIDESFIEFVDEQPTPSFEKEVSNFANAIVVKSLGKNFGLHGIRFGYAVATEALVSRLRKAIPPWNLNALAETVIRDLPEHYATYQESRRQVMADRIYLQRELEKFRELTVFPSQANFVYFKCAHAINGTKLRDSLVSEFGVLVRECGNKVGSSSQFFRIAANPRALTDRLVEALGISLERATQEKPSANARQDSSYVSLSVA